MSPHRRQDDWASKHAVFNQGASKIQRGGKKEGSEINMGKSVG
jgi:hypothetical protein